MNRWWHTFTSTITLILALYGLSCLILGEGAMQQIRTHALNTLSRYVPDGFKLDAFNNLNMTTPSAAQTPASNAASTMSATPANMPLTTLSYKYAAQKAMPAVVNIFTSKRSVNRSNQAANLFFDFFFNRNNDINNNNADNNSPKGAKDTDADVSNNKEVPYSLGSGVIVRQDGYIMTNNHVIEGADQIEVALHDGKKWVATVIGTDKETDLALLKIDQQNLPAIEYSTPNQIAVGDAVLAIGNPFGVGQTTTMGIVSALGRNQLGINTFENFIQTDAAINPGNSGGALIDMQGHLLGINTAIFSRNGGSQGIGFAIPAQTVSQIMHALLQNGKVSRGYLGISPQDAELVEQASQLLGGKTKRTQMDGALVARIFPEGPAAMAGMQLGDVIVKINEIGIKNTQDLLNTVAQLAPNSLIKCEVLRNQTRLTLSIKLAERPTKNSNAAMPFTLNEAP